MIALIFLDFPHIKGNLSEIPYNTALIRSLPYFLMGSVFGQLYVKWKTPDNLSGRIFVSSLLLIPLLYPKIYFFLTGRDHEMWMDVGIFFSVSLVFFLIIFLVPDDDALISNCIGDFLGKISYSLYLLHLPILLQIKDQAVKFPELFLPIFLIMAIVVSYVSYLVMENPLRLAVRAIASNKWVNKDAPRHP